MKRYGIAILVGGLIGWWCDSTTLAVVWAFAAGLAIGLMSNGWASSDRDAADHSPRVLADDEIETEYRRDAG